MKAVIFPFGPNDPILALTRDFPQLQWSVVSSAEALERAVRDADLLITSNRVCNPAYGAALRRGAGPSLRWMHFSSAGIERGIAMGLPEGLTITNSTGVKAGMVSEHAIALLLALLRRLPDIDAGQRGRRWLREEITARLATLEEAVVCVVGQGAIGRETARKLKALDARPIAVSRAAAAAGSDVEAVYSRARIGEAFAIADAVVICTSGDAGSHRMISAAELAQMKPTAVIVNVARGNIIDEPALIAALRQGSIAGAGLDVVDSEPLAPDSPLWDLPNVIISPHVAGGGSTGYPQHKKLFAQNLERFRAGLPLINECRRPHS